MSVKVPYKLSPILFALAIFFSCSDPDRHSLEPYYFPLQDLEQGRVYEYRPANGDSLPAEYWYFRSFTNDSTTYLVGQFIDYTFEVRQFVLEERVPNGMRLRKGLLVLPDSSGLLKQVELDIMHASVFPFYASDSLNFFLFEIHWKDPQSPSRSATLLRNLRFFGECPCLVLGRNRECIEIGGRELVAVNEEGVLELEYDFSQFYAKELGLVRYRKVGSENFVVDYVLSDTFSMEMFESRFGPVLKSEFSN